MGSYLLKFFSITLYSQYLLKCRMNYLLRYYRDQTQLVGLFFTKGVLEFVVFKSWINILPKKAFLPTKYIQIFKLSPLLWLGRWGRNHDATYGNYMSNLIPYSITMHWMGNVSNPGDSKSANNRIHTLPIKENRQKYIPVKRKVLVWDRN